MAIRRCEYEPDAKPLHFFGEAGWWAVRLLLYNPPNDGLLRLARECLLWVSKRLVRSGRSHRGRGRRSGDEAADRVAQRGSVGLIGNVMRSLIVTPSPLKVLVILGHPRKDSLCGALADSFVAGARKADVDLSGSTSASCSSTPTWSPARTCTRAGHSRGGSNWSLGGTHGVCLSPWWGTMPALMKASSTGC